LTSLPTKAPIPASSSKTIQFNQYSDLALATTPLTEGVAPTETLLTVTPITATIDQYGAYAPLTDLAELTTKHPLVTKTNELLGTQAARTYDRIINSYRRSRYERHLLRWTDTPYRYRQHFEDYDGRHPEGCRRTP
jgi:N4-gp56 family major capsid protein